MSVERRDHLVTLVAIVAIAFVLACLAHEAAGHGLACVAVGGRVAMLQALDLHCDLRALAPLASIRAERIVAAAGPMAALGMGVLALAVATREGSAGRSPTRTLLCWSLAAFALLPGAGYFLYSALMAGGDWAIAFGGSERAFAWRAPFAIGGAVLYWWVVRTLFRRLARLTGSPAADGARRARRIARVAYVVAALLALGAGLTQRGGASPLALSGMSGAVASLVAMSGLLWGSQPLTSPSLPRNAEVLAIIGHRWLLVALGALTAIGFVGILGPGLPL